MVAARKPSGPCRLAGGHLQGRGGRQLGGSQDQAVVGEELGEGNLVRPRSSSSAWSGARRPSPGNADRGQVGVVAAGVAVPGQGHPGQTEGVKLALEGLEPGGSQAAARGQVGIVGHPFVGQVDDDGQAPVGGPWAGKTRWTSRRSSWAAVRARTWVAPVRGFGGQTLIGCTMCMF